MTPSVDGSIFKFKCQKNLLVFFQLLIQLKGSGYPQILEIGKQVADYVTSFYLRYVSHYIISVASMSEAMWIVLSPFQVLASQVWFIHL